MNSIFVVSDLHPLPSSFEGVVATLDVGVVDVNMRFPETDGRGRASIKVLGVNDSTNNLV